jgi:transposase
MLPNKPRGMPRVNDRRILNGIVWVMRSGAPRRDRPQELGPYTTCYNRFVRWRRAGVCGRMMNAVAGAHDSTVQMIDTTIAGVHQHADPPAQRLADVPSPPSICWPINAIAR